MFFVISKIFWWLIQPLHVLIIAQLSGLVCLWRNRSQLGRWIFVVSTAAIAAITMLPLPEMLIRPLEQWVKRPVHLPDKIDGILLLTGGQRPILTHAYGQPIGGFETAVPFAALARRYPDAKLVVSGGSGELTPGPMSEAAVVKMFFAEQGMDPGRLILEDKSRNTYENGVFAKKLVQPKLGEIWVLITRAHHMPRAMGVFQKIGWDVIPYPADYRAFPDSGQIGGDEGISMLDAALHEWIGLAAYWSTGRM